ncbi:MAG: hypothetical protein ACR2JU_10855 [Nocardioidaceae bacterium]
MTRSASASQAQRTQSLADLAAHDVLTGQGDAAATLMMADTREQVAALNGAIRDRLVATGLVDDTNTVATRAGERIGVGDRVATRLNNHDLAVANHDIWTVTAVGADGSVTLRSGRPTDLHAVPAGYVREHVELAYATTVYGAQGETTGTGHLLLGEHTSAASAYVAMTRGRVNNVVHIVADDVEDAQRQWEAVFSRDRADLGPTVAAARAGEDVDRYGTQTPVRRIDEVLAELRAAWSEQAELTDHHQHLVGERDTLQRLAVIRSRFAATRERLGAEQSHAETSWREAHRVVADLDTTVKSQTGAELQTRVRAAWRHDLSQAQRAAGVVDQGAGRLGQRRRQVHAATDQLAVFAQRWPPVHPDLPADPTELARQVKWLHGGRVEEQIDAYVTRQVAGAHPDADAARQAERTASTRLDRARKAGRQLDTTLHNELRPFGPAAHVADPGQRLTTVTDQLALIERNLTTATTRVDRLRSEPPIRALPSDGLKAEHDQWAADRAAKSQAAARQAQERWRRQQQAHRILPTDPGHPTIDHGPSIGR